MDPGPLGPWTLRPDPEFEMVRMKPPMNMRMIPTDNSFLKLGRPRNIFEPNFRTEQKLSFERRLKPVFRNRFRGRVWAALTNQNNLIR